MSGADARWGAHWAAVQAAGITGPAAVLSRLPASLDRILLAQACLQYVRLYDRGSGTGAALVARLRADRQPEVRLAAHLAALRTLSPDRTPEAVAGVLAHLDAAGDAAGDGASMGSWSVGEMWADVYVRYDEPRPLDHFRQAAGLLADPAPVRRRVGLDMSRVALHEWRAAPENLTPSWVRMFDDLVDSLRLAALELVGSSRAASRRAADPRVPIPPPCEVRKRVDVDRDAAEAYLAARPVEGRLPPQMFHALLDHGPLTGRQAAQLTHQVFTRPSFAQARNARAWWRHAGVASAPALLPLLPQYFDDTALMGLDVLECLAAMGRHAVPVLGELDAFLGREWIAVRHRGSEEADLQADELVVEAALLTRRCILDDAERGLSARS
ncbi:hypothetical protein [Streptomyces beijiangensis]|uniref:Uncharacterized protein n=1 Tax=Streptomyces beijiangensis TaxID=163361 RepID=A0A939FC15_9ACTN|nr:hypothetical protein [Streptomyces beijiangensis]MBO0515842.1 hypothetical protein [Streptomyces beijiangensis]